MKNYLINYHSYFTKGVYITEKMNLNETTIIGTQVKIKTERNLRKCIITNIKELPDFKPNN